MGKTEPGEKLNAKAWRSAKPPRRLLVIRLQAIGDVVLTFPLLQALKNEYPGLEIDFLTRRTSSGLPGNLEAVSRVFALTNSPKTWRQIWDIGWRLPLFWGRRYQVVIDLQRNKASRFLRLILAPKAWAEFDRKGPATAIERYRQAVEATGLRISTDYPNLQLSNPNTGNQLLLNNGWDGNTSLVILNPAGLFSSRNWPLENFATFAKQWMGIYPNTQFLLMGDARLANKAVYLKRELGNKLIDLQQKTTPDEAFSILSKVQFMISEDSGLLWMAWVKKIPAIAMFGSTPGSRMNMGGSHARFLTSSDLPCGDCFLPDCRFGEIPLCLSRYTPEMMIAFALEISANGAANTLQPSPDKKTD